ncbi:unnamed protein product [Meloidogyne enterolobii]
MKNQFEQAFNSFRFLRGLPFAIEQSNRFSDSSVYSDRHSMTNSEVLDPLLEQVFFDKIIFLTKKQMLDNVMRDYIDSWYNTQLTSDKLFRESLKRTARRTIIALRTWLVYFLENNVRVFGGLFLRLSKVLLGFCDGESEGFETSV